MNEVNKLMFEIGIKDIRKSLDAYKKDLDKWVKDIVRMHRRSYRKHSDQTPDLC